MNSDLYPWQAQTWQAWQTLLLRQRLHHAMLYCAPHGSGREQLVAKLAKTLLCRQSEDKPCEQCHSCHLFAANSHPDFHYLQSEAPDKPLGVEAIRAGNKFALQTSTLGKARVIVIEPADNMGEVAANALLKTLEEPPKHCYFILLAASISTMLPTIISRCNQWIAPALPEQSVKKWLEKRLNCDLGLQVVRLHAGSPLAAKEAIEQAKLNEYHNVLMHFADFIQTKKHLFSLVALIVKNPPWLEWLSISLLDAIKLQQDASLEIVHCDAREQIEKIATLPTPLLFSQLQALNKLTAILKKQTGLNTELLVSDYLTHFIYSESFPC